MYAQPTLLSLIACIFYALVVAACVKAGLDARSNRQQHWHSKTWFLAALFFLLLIASRLLGLEEILRAELREWLSIEGIQDNRREIQGPIVAVAIVLFASIAMLYVYWLAQRVSGRRNIAVSLVWGACGIMLAVIAMRTVSLHSLDRLLNGPLKLNWIGDLGASVAVLLSAVIYIGIVNGRIDPRR